MYVYLAPDNIIYTEQSLIDPVLAFINRRKTVEIIKDLVQLHVVNRGMSHI